jgi:hypothetical protein
LDGARELKGTYMEYDLDLDLYDKCNVQCRLFKISSRRRKRKRSRRRLSAQGPGPNLKKWRRRMQAMVPYKEENDYSCRKNMERDCFRY